MKAINKNLTAIEQARRAGKRGIVLEGGSRSRKTMSVIDWLIWFTSLKAGAGLSIFFIKETYNSFKTTLYNDFNVRFPEFGLISPFQNVKEVASFNLFGNKIHLIGADQSSKFHGAGCDVFWINEALPVSKEIFDQLEMRCRLFWIMDYNPSCSDHWVFALEKRDDVTFHHSTMLDNPLIPSWQRKKILGYEPTPANIEKGTADDFMWKVYGLGVRASPQGLVFQNVTWIDSFPLEVDRIAYGMDFGHTNSPTAIVKMSRVGDDLYLEKLFYAPCDNPETLFEIITGLNVGRIWADIAEPGIISDLRMRGVSIYGAKKYPGSIIHGITEMKQCKIHIVRDADFRKEAENYKWREIGGIPLNEPIDDFNHLWDACRYAFVNEFRYK